MQHRYTEEHGVNVEGQLLRTKDEFGYVLTDISSEYSEDVLAELRAMPVTISLRTPALALNPVTSGDSGHPRSGPRRGPPELPGHRVPGNPIPLLASAVDRAHAGRQ